MPKLAENTVPSYRLHRQSGQALVTLSGKDILLGPHGTASSRAEYGRRISEWIVNGRQFKQESVDPTISELIAAFKAHAETYYMRPIGARSSEANNFRMALTALNNSGQIIADGGLYQDGQYCSLNIVSSGTLNGLSVAAQAINDNGQIAGIGPNGDAFLLTPTAIPEPTTFSLFGLCSLALLVRPRKQ